MTPANSTSAPRSSRGLLPETVGGRIVAVCVLVALTAAIVVLAVVSAITAGGPPAAAAIAAIVLAAIAGALFGLWVARRVRVPLRRMVDHVRAHGDLSLPADSQIARGFADDPSMPRELRELGGGVEELVEHLREREAALTEAVAVEHTVEETLSMVVAETPAVTIVVEGEAVSLVNPAAAVALGRTRDEVVARPLAAAFAGVVIEVEGGGTIDSTDLVVRALKRPVTVSLAREDQPARWYEFVAVRRQERDRDRLLLSGREVTEERRLQSLRSEVVSLISHDLRSPLSVVVGYLDLLRRPLADEDRDRAIEAAKRNAQRMADLLEDLLSAARAEELLGPTTLVPVPLSALAEEVVESLAAAHHEREVVFEPDCAAIVLGDEKRLRQVLVNLVTNAFKYAPGRTPVLVRVGCGETHATVLVEDHGPGVPEADRTRIFERFTRLEGGTGRPGMGLGLYIVRIIAESHGGSVHVEDTGGGGATFVVRLPLAGPETDQA